MSNFNLWHELRIGIGEWLILQAIKIMPRKHPITKRWTSAAASVALANLKDRDRRNQ